MNIQSPATLFLQSGQMLSLRDSQGGSMLCQDGSLWITQQDCPDDFILHPGQCLVLSSPGTVLVQAFGDSRLRLEGAGAKILPQD